MLSRTVLAALKLACLITVCTVYALAPLYSCRTMLFADVVTGERVERLRYHREIVRDCSWHPYEPMLVTTSFDGAVVKWDTRESPAPDEELKSKPNTLRRLQSRTRSDLADSMSDDL